MHRNIFQTHSTHVEKSLFHSTPPHHHTHTHTHTHTFKPFDVGQVVRQHIHSVRPQETVAVGPLNVEPTTLHLYGRLEVGYETTPRGEGLVVPADHPQSCTGPKASFSCVNKTN